MEKNISEGNTEKQRIFFQSHPDCFNQLLYSKHRNEAIFYRYKNEG